MNNNETSFSNSQAQASNIAQLFLREQKVQIRHILENLPNGLADFISSESRNEKDFDSQNDFYKLLVANLKNELCQRDLLRMAISLPENIMIILPNDNDKQNVQILKEFYILVSKIYYLAVHRDWQPREIAELALNTINQSIAEGGLDSMQQLESSILEKITKKYEASPKQQAMLSIIISSLVLRCNLSFEPMLSAPNKLPGINDLTFFLRDFFDVPPMDEKIKGYNLVLFTLQEIINERNKSASTCQASRETHHAKCLECYDHFKKVLNQINNKLSPANQASPFLQSVRAWSLIHFNFILLIYYLKVFGKEKGAKIGCKIRNNIRDLKGISAFNDEDVNNFLKLYPNDVQIDLDEGTPTGMSNSRRKTTGTLLFKQSFHEHTKLPILINNRFAAQCNNNTSKSNKI